MPGAKNSDSDAAAVSAGSRPADRASRRSAERTENGDSVPCLSELDPHGELRLARGRVDVRQQRRALAEQRPARLVSLPAVRLVLGALKFARLKMLNNCAMNSARYAPMRKVFDSRRSTLAKPGQSTVVTSVSPRARAERVHRVEIQVAAAGARHARPPAGRSVYPSPFRSSAAGRSEPQARAEVGDRRKLNVGRQLHDAAGDEAVAAIGGAVALDREEAVAIAELVGRLRVHRLAERVRDEELIAVRHAACRP